VTGRILFAVSVRRFDQATAERFISVLRASLTEEDAAAYAGVTIDTIWEWRARRPKFDVEVRRIKAEQALVDAGRVRREAQTNWRAAMVLARVAASERELIELRTLTTDPA
jgi:hypothetical protein